MSDRPFESFRKLVRLVMARVDYFALYPASVVAQNGDGTLELRAESSKLGSLSKVPLRLGIPGSSARVAAGARVLLGFEGGDAKRPIATLWDTGSLVELRIGGVDATKYAALAEDVRSALMSLRAIIQTTASSSPGVAFPAALSTALGVGLAVVWPPPASSLGSSTVRVK